MVKKTKKESTLYYFYSVGCGFCKKMDPIIDELNKKGHNILKLDLADKDNQGLKNELSKEYKKQCGTPWLIDASNGNQVCGYREKDIIEKWVNGEDIPAPPKPNGVPPRPPFMNATDEEVKTWKDGYNKWLGNNEHLPNLQPVDTVLNNFKNRKKQLQNQQTPQEKDVSTKLMKRVDILERKLDKLMKHLGVK